MSLGSELCCLGERMQVKQTGPLTLSSAFKLEFFSSSGMLECLHWKPGLTQRLFRPWVIVEDCFPGVPRPQLKATGAGLWVTAGYTVRKEVSMPVF